MREGRTKVGTVNVSLSSAFGEEQAVASWAEYVDGVISRQIGQAHRQDRLTLTKNSWTSPKGRCSIFFIHGVHPSIRNNIAAFILKNNNSLK
jgi:hypothetical protein